MIRRNRSSLQSVLDTYQYLIQGLTGRKAAPSTASEYLARDMTVPPALREGMAEALHRLPPTLTVAGLSSASMWVKERWYLKTSGDVPLVSIDQADLIPVGFSTDATPLSWHDYFYRYSAAKAVLVSHPPHALACIAKNITPAATALPSVATRVGEVVMTVAIDDVLEGLIMQGRAFLAQDGHLVTWGGTLPEAIMLADMVERWCQVMLLRDA